MGRILRPEKKFFDHICTDTAITSAATFITADNVQGNTGTIVGIPQGTTETTRIGRKCTVTNIYARINLEFISNGASDLTAATSAHESVRVIMYWDKQCNGNSDTANTMSASILEQTKVYAFRNLANNKRFKILYDKVHSYNTTAIAAGNGTSNDSERVIRDYQVRISKKCFIPIEFLLTTGAMASNIATNNIGILVYAKHGSRMNVNGESRIRIRFIDY